ncbi:hypothetical protein BP6252_02265 [Coleophoma cylindrospora]|uniref:Uncharacterized protein n=1 Tax=Coleophoma cylindrospora TaxID=1849047 RepID=A0A3D8SEB4_9HELO|nr:hypothetical protein BP6252_02265 [Coleophoma cylindrospora]
MPEPYPQRSFTELGHSRQASAPWLLKDGKSRKSTIAHKRPMTEQLRIAEADVITIPTATFFCVILATRQRQTLPTAMLAGFVFT